MLEPGDEILIGGTRLRYDPGGPPPAPKVESLGAGVVQRRLSVWDTGRFAPASQIGAQRKAAL